MGLQHIAKSNPVIDGLAILISGSYSFIIIYIIIIIIIIIINSHNYYYVIIFNSLYYCSNPLIKHFLNSVFAFR